MQPSNSRHKMKYILIILLNFLIACESKNKGKPTVSQPTSFETTKIKLLGYWGGMETNLPTWKISNDSIKFVDENKTYDYQFINGDMIINRTDSKLIFSNISIVGDTLIFYPHGPDSETRTFRIKNARE